MNNKELIVRYPFLRKNLNNTSDEIEYSWFDDIPKGWALAFGEQMCEELLHILRKANYVDEYCIMEIKEKYGSLRWHDGGVPEEIWDEYQTWIDKYEGLSYATCINCGKPATIITTGWIYPLCDECAKNAEK